MRQESMRYEGDGWATGHRTEARQVPGAVYGDAPGGRGREPLSAILTLWPDGRVRIDGSRSDWLFGVSPASAGYPECDVGGRETLPRMQSADLKLNFRK